MALKSFLHKLTASDDRVDEEQTQEFGPSRSGVVAIADVVPRQPSTVVGEILSVQVISKAGAPWLEVTVSDGTGKLVAMWTGRREIAGIKAGQRLVLKGRSSPTGPGGRLLLYNPLYELL